MSVEEIKRLQEDAKTNEELKNALTEAGSDLDKIAEVGSAKGYDFTAEELKAAVAEKQGDQELGDDDLEKVAGGAVLSVFAGLAV